MQIQNLCQAQVDDSGHESSQLIDEESQANHQKWLPKQATIIGVDSGRQIFLLAIFFVIILSIYVVFY